MLLQGEEREGIQMAKIVRSISPGSQDLNLLEIGELRVSHVLIHHKMPTFLMVQKSQEATWDALAPTL